MKIKSSGIVKRLDDLARIVIPVEVRKELGINKRDYMEIFITEDGGVYLRRHKVDIDLKKND